MNMRTRTIVLGAVALLAFAGCARPIQGEPPTEGRQVQSIVRNTASPFCPGKTLDSCPSPKASAWRRDIQTWVADGVPEPEIRTRLQARVPGFELTLPPVKAGWVIPLAAVSLSTLWFVVMAWRMRSRRRPGSLRAEYVRSDDLDDRLDHELALLD